MPPELEPRSPRFAATPHWIARLRGRGDGGETGVPPRRRPPASGRFGCLVGAGLFFVAGLGMSLFFLVPLSQAVAARGWEPVSCEILSSRVASHDGDGGSTHSVEVRYRYEAGGRSFQGTRYRFLGGSSSGREGKQRVVEALPAGTVTTCWVDPDDPRRAVLDRGLSWEYLLVLFPLVFVGLGAIGLWVLMLERRKRPSGTAAAVVPGETVGGFRELEEVPSSRPGVLPEAPAPGALTLEPVMSPLGRLGCATGVTLVWNGMVGIFVWHLSREPQWVLGCVLVPFVLIGLVLLASIPYSLLALANPRPHLRLADGRLTAGRSTTLDWRFSRAAGRLRSLSIRLEGRETVRFQRGDSSSQRTEVVARIPLVEETQQALLAQGSVRLELPAGAMHSFEGASNRILWVLVVHGAIARWPDVQDELEVVVLPQEAE